jgi:hypothetical protein
LVGAALVSQRDTFPLPLPDQPAFELGEGTHHREHEVGHGGVLPGEDQLFRDELHSDASTGGAPDQGAQVVQVAGEPIHAVHHHCVPVTCDAQQLGQFRSGRVPARGLVREDPLQNLAVKLAFSFWSRVLTRTSLIRCLATDASKPAVDLSA